MGRVPRLAWWRKGDWVARVKALLSRERRCVVREKAGSWG